MAGDLNGDGTIDLVVGNDLSGNISVLLGNGDGTFQTAVTYPAGAGIRDLAMADLNGDGVPDIVTVNGNTYAISVLLGNGDGTFQSAVDYAVNGAPRSIAIMDYNGDGFLDLAVPSYADSVLNILLGNGDGTFVPGPTIKTGPQPTSVRSADFNNDGKPDLVVTIGGHPNPPVDLQNYATVLLNTPLSLSTASLGFRTQTVGATSGVQSVVLTNIGAVPLTLKSFTLKGTSPQDFLERTTCGSSLAAGASCKVNVRFSPTATGARMATLAISDSALTVPQIVTLLGMGS